MGTNVRNRLNHLLTIWTVKEAYIKALGHGLSMDLKRIEVSFSEPAPYSLITSQAKVHSTTEGDDGPQANSVTRCDLCQGIVKLIVDKFDVRKGMTDRLRWHMQLGVQRIEDEKSLFGCQEYVWASVWTTAASKLCQMEEMMGEAQRIFTA